MSKRKYAAGIPFFGSLIGASATLLIGTAAIFGIVGTFRASEWIIAALGYANDSILIPLVWFVLIASLVWVFIGIIHEAWGYIADLTEEPAEKAPSEPPSNVLGGRDDV